MQSTSHPSSHRIVLGLRNARYAGRDARCFPQIFSYQADNRFSPFVFHVREFRKVSRQRWDGLVGIDRKGDADLRSGDHVDRHFMSIKGLEDGLEKPVRQQLARHDYAVSAPTRTGH